MTDWPILSTVTFLPLVGVVLLLLMNGESETGRKNVLWISLITTVFTFVVSLFIWTGFDNANRSTKIRQLSQNVRRYQNRFAHTTKLAYQFAYFDSRMRVKSRCRLVQ